MPSKKPNLFVLTGSGFSLPYLLFEGKELSTKLITEFVRDKKQVIKAYKRYYRNNQTDDLEELAELLALLYKSLCKKRNELPFEINFEHLIGFAEEMIRYEVVEVYDFNRSAVMKTNYLLSHVFDVNENFLEALKNIAKPYEALYDLKNIILTWISEFIVPSSQLIQVNNFMWNLLERYNVKYYTLNYDDLFFRALFNTNNYKLTDYENFLKGINLGFKSVLNDRFLRLKQVLDFSKDHCCFHLHGSVLYAKNLTLKFTNDARYWYTYSIDTEDASRARINPNYIANEKFYEKNIDPQSLAITYQHHLISGFLKQSKVFYEPYHSMYQRAFIDIINADKVLVVGYSFFDSHINSLLAKALVNTKELEVVDLASVQENSKVFEDRRNEIVNIFRPELAPDELPLSFWKYDFVRAKDGSHILSGDNMKIKYYPFGIEKYIKGLSNENLNF